ANKKSLEDGSDTSGGQSYFDSYADSRKWVKEKWVDYIAPQIYWNIGNDKSDYEVLVKWWNDTVADTGVKLYIGHAAYRWIGADKSSPWYGTGELTRQLSLNRLCGNVSGSIFFRLGTIRGNTAVSQEISDFFNGRQTSEFYVGRPSTDIQTTLTSFYVTGVSDPKETLTLNGKEVENRSASGFFGLLVKLRKGVNSLVFSQGDKKITRVIYSGASNPIQKTMPSAVISKSSVYPQSRELMQAVKTISLTCKAPAGSKVTVTINGRTLNMKQAKTSCPSDGKYYEASFSASYSVPQQKTGVLSLGSPVYRMTLGQKKDKAAAPGSLAVAFSKPSLLAEVTAEKADTYPYANSALGADGPLYKKMRDYVEVITGNYIKLSSGEWIKKSSVKLLSVKGAYSPQVTSVKYTVSAKEDVVHFETSLFPSAVLSFYDNKLTVLFPTLTRIVRPELPSGAICSDAQISLNNSRGSCVLTVDKEKLGGYYIKPTETGFDLVIRRKPTANTGLSPLSGITVMLDAGHGGSELGALGPMGGKCPEKTVNLSLALKLKSELELLGAKVLLTRGSDTSVTLYQRLDLSREKLPDLFLSLHSNSLSDDTDISKYSGASVYYREAWVDSLAQSVLKSASSDISRVSGGAFVRRHYITKATWAPSLILEAGFLPNPMDFEWLRDPGEQEKLAQSLAKCILQYFSN
ncbi:MAG: N-acetylmuramoyl-L-alanine amidase, partial [Bacillota bacterium]|nr:N-acetylmuramoyl-L-alanine amidase [Bacillota bacterium]